MKKIIILTLALAGTAGTPFLLHAVKTKNNQKRAHAITRYETLSTALNTNKILQRIVAQNLKQQMKERNIPNIKKLRKQLRQLRTNEWKLKREINVLLKNYPGLAAHHKEKSGRKKL